MTPPIRPVRPRRPQRKSRSALFVDRYIGMLRKAEKQGSERQGQKMEENFPAMLQCGAKRGARNPGIAWRIVPGCGKPMKDQTRARSACQNSTETLPLHALNQPARCHVRVILGSGWRHGVIGDAPFPLPWDP